MTNFVTWHSPISLILQSANELSFVHLLFNHDDYQRVQIPGMSENEKNVEDCEDEVTKMSEMTKAKTN